MAKKKRKKKGGRVEGDLAATGASGAAPKAPAIAQRPFAEALRGLAPAATKAPTSPPAPRPAAHSLGSPRPTAAAAPRHGYADRAAFHQAMAGVRPLGAPPPGRPGGKGGGAAPPSKEDRVATAASREAAEEAARARLDALVAGGVRFELERGEDGVRGRRSDAHPSHLAELVGGGVVPEASLDLHGLRTDEAAREVRRFVRTAHREGRRVVLVVFGKGRHSEGGSGVLEDRVLGTLTDGGVGSVVLAFATAPERLGGHGAVLLRLGLR